MENQYQKIVNVSYLVFCALIAFISLQGMMKLSDAYDLETKIKTIEFIIRGLSIFLGVSLFVILYKNPTVNNFMNEVVVELLTKVSWPASRDTGVATVIVIITVIIAGIVLSVFDWLWVMALRLLI